MIRPPRSTHRVAAALLGLLLFVSPGLAASPPAAAGTGGAVASEHPLATAAGLAALHEGGNAVDAAVATALALAVVFPEAGNLGGGGFAVVRMGGELAALDFREAGPGAARRDLFLDAKGEPVPGASLVGPLASGVPGSPAGLRELHRRFGKLPWPRVVAPALRLARDGFPVDRNLFDRLSDAGARKLLARFPESAAVWLPAGAPPPLGSVLRQPDLAATLALYADTGAAGIQEGAVAAAVEAASKKYGGILTAADLAAYRAAWRAPVTFDAFGWKLVSMPPPSAGGILLAQTLGMLERLGWRDLPRSGAERDHLLAEALRRAYTDRRLLGDPSTAEASVAELIDPAWIASRAAGVDRARATPSRELAPWSRDSSVAAGRTGGSETTHLSVVDKDGNLVALTTTVNELFGCGLYVPGAGFFLNSEMDDFTTAPGRPNLFGLVQGEANAVRPGNRMLSSMTPTIAWKDGDAIALGGRGGSRITTHVAQVLLDLLVDGDRLQAAVDRPRFHHQAIPDLLEAEADALTPETREALGRKGHKVEDAKLFARVTAVRRWKDGRVEAAVDARSSAARTGAGVEAPEP
jgi:gamma-glutamyltranspeptidase/glutathione hydrolase